MVHTSCAVRGCYSSSLSSKDIRFHQFPRTEERCKIWLDACKRKDLEDKSCEILKYTYICSLHFEKEMYGKKILKKTAVPTLLLPNDYGPDLQLNIITNTNATNGCRDRSPVRSASIEGDFGGSEKLSEPSRRKRKLFFDSLQLKKKIKVKEDETPVDTKFLKLCDTLLSPKLSAIAKIQIYLKFHYKNNKYSREFKSFCFNLHQKSPLAYRYLSKMISLPSKSHLAHTYFPVQTKSQEMWDILAGVVKHLPAFDRECVLCMDTVKLKMGLCYSTKEDRILGLHEVDGAQQPVAAHFALTLLVRGIRSTWSQLIGFSFITSNEIDDPSKTWIFSTIKRLVQLGLNVRAVVSDLGSNFLTFSKSLGIDYNTCFFKIEDHTVYYIYDVPDLLKCVRNSLLKYNFRFDGRTARWENIMDVYQIDKSQDVPLAPHLTDSHMRPNSYQKKILRYAVDIFSNSVAETLKKYKPTRYWQTVKGTLYFVQIINELFDLLNSSNTGSFETETPYKGTTDQEEFLDNVQQMFNDMMFKNKKNNCTVTSLDVKFVRGFNVTINSIRNLYSDMKSEGHEYIFTRNLNKECLDNFFTFLKRGNKGPPTCLRYIRTFRKVFLYQILNLSDATNLTDGFDQTVSQLLEFSKNIPGPDSLCVKPKKKLLKVYNIPDKNGAYYLCGHLLRKSLKRHKRGCRSVVDLRIRLKTYSASSNSLQGLQSLPSGYVHYVYKLERAFTSIFASFIGNDIGSTLYRNMSTIDFVNQSCECFTKSFLLKLFIRMRIFHTVRVNNNLFKTSDCETRRYLAVPFIIN